MVDMLGYYDQMRGRQIPLVEHILFVWHLVVSHCIFVVEGNHSRSRVFLKERPVGEAFTFSKVEELVSEGRSNLFYGFLYKWLFVSIEAHLFPLAPMRHSFLGLRMDVTLTCFYQSILN